MKIAQSRLAFSSEHRSAELETELSERSLDQVGKTTIRNDLRRGRRISRMLIDRIDISHRRTVAAQSNYSGSIQSRSSVHSLSQEQSTEYEYQQAVEKIVGGIIDKEIAVRQIRRNKDVRIPSDPSGPASDGMKAADDSGGLVQYRSTMASRLSVNRTRIHFEEESTQFSSQGLVTTEDGRVIDFSLDMSLDRSFLSRTEEQTLVQRWQEDVGLIDPLVISLDGKVPALTDTTFEFDLDSDGETDHINFTAAGSGFLALDRNEDSVINDGSELFGPGTGNGFNELAAFDEDQNRWIDENDAVFSKLKVWTKDADGNDHLISLKDAGVGAIALEHADTQFDMTDAGNQLNGQLKQSGIFLFENGNVGSVHQVDLVSHKQDIPDVNMNELEIAPRVSAAGGPVPSLATATVVPPVEVHMDSNPLQDLLDKINDMKKRMTDLIEKMNPVSGTAQAEKGSRKRSYDYMMPDTSFMIPGHDGIPGRQWHV